MNEIEYRLLFGELPSPNNCREVFTEDLLKPGAVLLVTLGNRGCFLCVRSRRMVVVSQIRAPKTVRPVDTTGCGDIFSGAFIAALLKGQDFHAAARFAVATATHRVERDVELWKYTRN